MQAIINEAIKTVEQEVCNPQGDLNEGQVVVLMPVGQKPNAVEQLVRSWIDWNGIQNYWLVSFYRAEEYDVDDKTHAWTLNYNVEEEVPY